MSCTSCGSIKSNCSCSDNCPNKTSDITVFDGVLNTLDVPCGASLNDILALLEAYTTNMVNELDGMTSIVVGVNPYGLTPGTYSIQQFYDAITTYLSTLSTSQVYVDVTKTGANVLLATPTGGVAPYTYQWFIQDSRAQINISGSSTSASVTLTPTIASSDALVKVRITDANGRKANDCYYIRITT
jgi:uncharacterized membrane protein